MADGKTVAIAIVGVLLGLSGYFGFDQYRQNGMLDQRISDLEGDNVSLEQRQGELISYGQNLTKSLEESQANEQELSQMVESYKSRADEESSQNAELEHELSGSLSPPYTIIQDRNVIWVFEDSKGNPYKWEMPIDTYRSIIESPEPNDMNYLERNDGTQFAVLDYTKFVESTSFSKVIDDVYANAKGDYDFVYEVWYIASQLTTYSSDIEDNPRWALETLIEGGGDCEDLTILIASMLKASAHTSDWTIKMWYFDADSPDDPIEMNHVALQVETADFKTFVESTTKVDGLEHWPSINGWPFEV